MLGFEQVARSAEALQRLKPQEVRALWLKAMGNSYQEICDATGWTYTKVNRCLAEGRKSFLARYAGIEAGEECRRWAPVLSAMVDGEATAEADARAAPAPAQLRRLPGRGARTAGRERAAGRAVPGRRPAAPRRATGRSRRAGHALARVWDALWGDLGDRVAGAAFRAQSVAQGIVPGRSAAVVASVAALAGGGFAIDQAVVAPRTAPAAPAVAQPARATTLDGRRLVRPHGRAGADDDARAPRPGRSPRAGRGRGCGHRRARAAVVRTPRRTATATDAPARPPPRPRHARRDRDRDAGGPGARRRRRTRPSAPPRRLRAAPPGEFGVETP